MSQIVLRSVDRGESLLYTFNKIKTDTDSILMYLENGGMKL
jgi:hypothetical protein